jgi:quinol-cytochrome oxidoreductase complex cytochrome b subunit
MRDVHRVAGTFFVAVALVTAFAAVVLAVQLRRVSPGAIGVGFLLVAFGASISGVFLPWDQLALNAVTVGESIKGFWEIDSDQIRYVLIDGAEISPDTFFRWFWTHTTVIPVVLIGLALLVVLSTRSGRHERGEGIDGQAQLDGDHEVSVVWEEESGPGKRDW